jgi:hypothetical protein
MSQYQFQIQSAFQHLALIPQPLSCLAFYVGKPDEREPLLPILGEGEPEKKAERLAPSPKLGRGLGRGQANVVPL